MSPNLSVPRPAKLSTEPHISEGRAAMLEFGQPFSLRSLLRHRFSKVQPHVEKQESHLMRDGSEFYLLQVNQWPKGFYDRL